jgi:hypothetical protein
VLVVALMALSPDPAAPLTLDAAPIRGDLVLSEGMQNNRTDGAVRFHRLVQKYLVAVALPVEEVVGRVGYERLRADVFW